MNPKQSLAIKTLFDINQTLACEQLKKSEYPWEVLPSIRQWIIEIGQSLSTNDYEQIDEYIWVARSTKIAASASLNGPLIIGHETEIRHCAFIRGNALVGNECVIGNATELKNVILLNNVQVPHYNYVGDSILGYKAHIGAGSITSNIKSDKTLVKIKLNDQAIETGLKKFGAMIGDNVEIGSNSVLNPGSIIGKNTQIYPLSMVRGFVPPNTIYKNNGEIIYKT